MEAGLELPFVGSVGSRDSRDRGRQQKAGARWEQLHFGDDEEAASPPLGRLGRSGGLESFAMLSPELPEISAPAAGEIAVAA